MLNGRGETRVNALYVKQVKQTCLKKTSMFLHTSGLLPTSGEQQGTLK